jgi:hypothetical protein
MLGYVVEWFDGGSNDDSTVVIILGVLRSLETRSILPH